MKYFKDLFLTALAPMIWGSTYLVTTELLPPDRPLLAGALRALPVGLGLVAIFGRLPQGVWWWRTLVLGTLNIGLFFALLFVAAYRLPGGVAATLGAVQPLLVASFAGVVLAQRPSLLTLASGVVGVIGVALLVLSSEVNLEFWGILAALASAVCMAAGTVLTRLWARPVPVLLFTGWQLVAGGLLLGVLSLGFEGRIPALSLGNALGYSYLGLIGGGLAYTLWFRGIGTLGTSVAFLGLLSPVVATILGYTVLGQHLSRLQGLGLILVLGSVLASQKELLDENRQTLRPAL
jgi:probable blue pigment (indigoidine) exporter